MKLYEMGTALTDVPFIERVNIVEQYRLRREEDLSRVPDIVIPGSKKKTATKITKEQYEVLKMLNLVD